MINLICLIHSSINKKLVPDQAENQYFNGKYNGKQILKGIVHPKKK